MFTGIITALGHIRSSHTLGGDGLTLELETPPHFLDDVQVGDSIAINGACMTATTIDHSANRFKLDVSAESLRRTAGLDRLGPVNLEKALRLADRLGGHLVSGHVDATGRVICLEPIGASYRFEVLAPPELARFLAFKGSVTVHGVSLTINEVTDGSEGCVIAINLIPHTLSHTTLGELKAGDLVNLEVDLIARYCERMESAPAPKAD